MKRTSRLQLPDTSELHEMIRKESPRTAFRTDYLLKNPDVFSGFRELANQAKIDVGIIDNFHEISFSDVVKNFHEISEEMNSYIKQNQKSTVFGKIYESLNCSNPAEKSDLLFVFGNPNNTRIEKAVELYKAGVAPKIMTTGRSAHWEDGQQSEAERMEKYAIEMGVPENDIIVEKLSISTPDNVKRGVDIMEKMNWNPQKIAVVTDEFHLRRAVIDMYKFTNWNIEISTASPTANSETNINSWHKTEAGRRAVLNEYVKIIIEAKVDQVLMEEKI